MKIVSSGRGIHTPEFYKKKQKAKHIRFTFYTIGILVLLVLTVFFFRWDKFIISEVVIGDEIAVDREEIKEAVQRELDGYYFYVIPRSNAFIYKLSNPKDRLLGKFPRFKSLDLNLEGFKKLVVRADERSPFALYCIQDSECFFLDEEGLIFRAAPSFSDGVYFIYTLDNPIANPLGQEFLPAAEFKSLSNFIKNLATIGVNPVTLEADVDDYRLVLVNGAKIIWRRESDLSIIYSNLEAFLSDEAIKSQPNFLDKVSSLDLRTDNKVFWKIQ